MLLNPSRKNRFLGSTLLLLILTKSSSSASFALAGCFPSSDVSALSYSNSYTFQSSGYCQGQCSDSRVAALIGGKDCYCGNDAPLSSNEVDQSNCNVPCQGYPYENCGGNGYYIVYVNADVQDSPTSTSTTSTTSTPTTTSTTSTTSTTPTTTSTSTTSSTSNTNGPSPTDGETTSSSTKQQNKITLYSTVTTDPSGSPIESIVYKTITADPSDTANASPSPSPSNTSSSSTSSSSSSPSGSDSKSSTSQDHKKLSAGGIAGAAVGGIIGLLLVIGGIIFFFWRKRRHDDDDEYEDDEYTLSGAHMNEKSAGGLDPPPPPMIGPNPFLLSAGYNHFDTAQQQDNQQSPNHQHNYSSSSGTQSEDRDSSQGFAIINNGGSGQHSRAGSRIINHSNDPSLNSTVAAGSPTIGGANDYDNTNQIQHQFQQPEYGRRRLSNGSLPDMIARQPGSLKVVNN